VVILEPTVLYQLLSKSGENVYFLSSCKCFKGGTGSEIYSAGITPKISAYSIEVIIAVLMKMAINYFVTVDVIC
jgi:hypothetical protein